MWTLGDAGAAIFNESCSTGGAGIDSGDAGGAGRGTISADFVSGILDGSACRTGGDTGAPMVEEISSTFDTVVDCVLTVEAVASAGLTDVTGVSYIARSGACILTVAAL